MTVKQKIEGKALAADEIRAELARRKMSKRRLSEETGISYQYLVQILNGYVSAEKMRTRITKHLFPEVGLVENLEFKRALGLGGCDESISK